MITVVIPARMASSRYPGKPLELIMGLPMVEHVRRRALLAKGVDHVAVATCDEAIKIAVEAFGGSVVMTKDTHLNGVTRVEEAMQRLPGEISVMVQGDEPLLNPETISQTAQPLLDEPSLEVVNLLSPLKSAEQYTNQNVVKAVCDRQGNLIYLTRAPVPFFRNTVEVPVFCQTGIIAFRSEFLTRFCSMPMTPLEKAESVDMLRVIENGIRIKGVVATGTTIGVDHPTDVALVESILRDDPVQRELYERTIKMGGGK